MTEYKAGQRVRIEGKTWAVEGVVSVDGDRMTVSSPHAYYDLAKCEAATGVRVTVLAEPRLPEPKRVPPMPRKKTMPPMAEYHRNQHRDHCCKWHGTHAQPSAIYNKRHDWRDCPDLALRGKIIEAIPC